jgi:DNA repair exonuclease SbcCD ATPase subunit
MIETLQKQNEDNLEVIMTDIKNTEDNITELESTIDALQAEVDSLLLGLSEQDETKKTFRELTKKLNQTEQMLTRLEKEMKFYTENDNCSTCRQPIAEDHKTKICSLIEEEKQDKNKIRVEHETSIDNVEKKLDEYTETLGRIREKEKEISNHNTTIRANQSYITKNQKEYSRLMSIDKENLKEKDILKNLAREGKEQVEKQQELKEEKVLGEYAMALLKDSGIKSKIIRHYLPTMNKLINKYLTVMDFFAQFNLDENFNETIKSRHRDDFSYMSFSEGEKLRIDLAILLTWREIARLKNSANTNLLILDEVFDSSLDSGGTDEFMKLLHNLGSRCNVYIISHKADQLADKFNNMMVFDKKNNFSKLKIV